MEKDNVKTYTLYAGVNGAGKSTVYDTTGCYGNENRVNSDEILVSNGGDWRNKRDQIRAGMEAVRKVDYFIKQGISFNQETKVARCKNGRWILYNEKCEWFNRAMPEVMDEIMDK